jgi:hypothetical protein
MLLIIAAYSSLIAVFILFRHQWGGGRNSMGIRFGMTFGLVWFCGMLEASIALGIPLWKEALFGLSEVPPLLLLGWLSSRLLLPRGFVPAHRSAIGLLEAIRTVSIVALCAMIGRFASSALVAGEPVWFEQPAAMLAWSPANGLVAGSAYLCLGRGIPLNPMKKAIIFGFLIYGVDWTAFTMVAPLLFAWPAIDLLRSFILRALIDCACVSLGILAAGPRSIPRPVEAEPARADPPKRKA